MTCLSWRLIDTTWRDGLSPDQVKRVYRHMRQQGRRIAAAEQAYEVAMGRASYARTEAIQAAEHEFRRQCSMDNIPLDKEAGQ